MKRILVFYLFLLTAMAVAAKTIKLDTGGETLWNQAGARFAVWHWTTGADGQWSDFMTGTEDVYETEIADESDCVIFIRFAKDTAKPDWSATIWNRTGDLSIPKGLDTYVIMGWGEGEGMWKSADGDVEHYASSVPAKCKDVMLQGFYWDSYDGWEKPYGDTKWKTLRREAEDIGRSFDLIWLPPSSHSVGGTGYIPLEYHNQNSDWGSATDLRLLISELHKQGVKVIADVVINHLGNKNGWADFYRQDFGAYGRFQPDASWICQDDEVNYDDRAGSAKGKATGPWDDGYGDGKNYEAARDLAHSKEEVRQMCRAYLKWLRYQIGYDGFRYDFCKGFHGSHFNDYNSYAGAYFSVLEYWDGSVDALRNVLNDAGWNTLTFDFPGKYAIYNNGINQNNFVPCKGSGLLGAGLGKHAVTFIDNHDSFREDWNSFSSPSDPWYETKVMQANAYLLSMPGVPCVAYPHWYEFKDKIRPLIEARKAAGVHSESAVQDISGTEDGGTYYNATITGTDGTIILRLGKHASHPAPDGYLTAARGAGYAVYYTCRDIETGVTQTDDVQKAAPTKYMENGRLLIRYANGIYDVSGRKVE